MKKFEITLFCLLLVIGSLSATNDPEPLVNNGYRYFVDLDNIENDKVPVELIAPKIDKPTITFFMPKIIPGTYTIYDFGRFVSDFHAFDQKGNELPVTHSDVNAWIIGNARSLYKISYKVDDTFDNNPGKPVYGMSGTNIEAGRNIVLNGHGFYGYFEHMKQKPFEVNVQRPENFYGSSALNPVRTTNDSDTYTTVSYNHLVDTPMMYCKPDTTVIQVAGAEVLISVFSPSGNIQSKFLGEKFAPLLKAQKDYLGGKLPVDKYAFVMYFLSPEMQTVGTGALEHNYSSFYVLPDMPQEQIAPFIVNIAAHEFFHIVTPLNIHSKEIHYFDFNDPDMSRHLWMYEGVTEYFAHHVQLTSGLANLDQFLNTMAQKIFQTQTIYNDHLAFTEMSRNCLKKYSNEYGNVYEKGALIGLGLDIELRKLSNGDYGLVDMMHELAEKFGNDKPFNDKKLFREIRKITYPEIGKFLKTYVGGKTPLPLEAIFSSIGVRYQAPEKFMDFTIGNVGIGVDPETNRMFVQGIQNLNAFGKALGYQDGDVFHKLNGDLVPESGFQQFFAEVMSKMKEGDLFEAEVYRKDKNGVEKLVVLSAKTIKVEKTRPPKLTPSENPTAAQLKLRRDWMGH
ncbi:MAG: peptidase M61 [Saprospiraceae bacterium]|nr:peptidase M61 [Saprospiraceae bacterium]MCB9323007.1 peptidase M61 [Lewinellaceae bacterium]